MKITIKGDSKEIAALVLAIQERQEHFIPTHGFEHGEIKTCPQDTAKNLCSLKEG